jgi:hypothetical protein
VFPIGWQNDKGQDHFTIGPDPDLTDWVGLSVMLLDLETEMNQHYMQFKGSKPVNESNKALTLSAFGGMCYHCKKMGHKAHECPKKAGNNS